MVRKISALQLKRAIIKECKSYAVTITNKVSKYETDKLKIEDIPVLK